MSRTESEKKVPKIKICGLTSAEEASWIVEERVDYAGIVVYYPKSKRNLGMERARELIPLIQRGTSASGEPIRAVAVTVSPDEEQIRAIRVAGFDMIQIHGALSQAAFDAAQMPVIRAFNGYDGENPEAYEEACRHGRTAACLFDAGVPGSGTTFDWNVFRRLPRYGKPLFLAGGLTPDNVGEAVRAASPDVVDVSSGVEKGCGVGKDREKIRGFVEAVRRSFF